MKVTVSKTWTCDAGAVSIVEHLRRAGHEAYLVGGCVRDLVMGLTPTDWDVATDAVPERIEALFPHTVPVGKAFGVMVVLHEGTPYEVATFRGDGAYLDGRRPSEVVFTGPEEDVQRRDFTINALMYDPLEGLLYDWVEGLEDLRRHLVRTVGDPHLRFSEDRLRLLRAVRFAARTGFTLEEETARAVRQMVDRVLDVSAERIGDELTRMLSEGTARDSFVLLENLGLLAVVLPEVAALKGVHQPPEFHPEGDVWLHTLIMLEGLDATIRHMPEKCPPGLCGDRRERIILGWAVLLHDVGKPLTFTRADRIRFNGHDTVGAELAGNILRRLRRPKAVIQAVEALVRRHMSFLHIRDMRVSKRRRFAGDELYPLHLELHRLDCMGSHGKMDGYEFGVEAWREEEARPPTPEPLLSGHDLLAVGYAPSPQMGRILRAVADARLEGILTNKDEALTWVQQRFPKLPRRRR